METETVVNSFSLRGEAPSSQLEFLLKALLALANQRKLNPSEYLLYSQNRALAQHVSSLSAQVSSLAQQVRSLSAALPQ